MTWTNNDFRAYPARVPKIHRLAAASLGEPQLVGGYNSYASATAAATELRKFRYLVRANPGVDFALDKLLEQHTFRSKTSKDSLGIWSLYLIAKPHPSSLLSLNPHLADILSPERQ